MTKNATRHFTGSDSMYEVAGLRPSGKPDYQNLTSTYTISDLGIERTVTLSDGTTRRQKLIKATDDLDTVHHWWEDQS